VTDQAQRRRSAETLARDARELELRAEHKIHGGGDATSQHKAAVVELHGRPGDDPPVAPGAAVNTIAKAQSILDESEAARA
jgi:hypothetical protein